MLKAVLTPIFDWLPVLFGIGFLAPVIAAFMNVSGLHDPFGITAIYYGLGIGLTWGLVAKLTGRWI